MDYECSYNRRKRTHGTQIQRALRRIQVQGESVYEETWRYEADRDTGSAGTVYEYNVSQDAVYDIERDEGAGYTGCEMSEQFDVCTAECS